MTERQGLTARRVLLDGLTRDADIFQLVSELAPLHPRDNICPGEVFRRIATDALDWCRASRADRCPWRDSASRFLPERTFRGRQNTKLQYAVLAAAAIHGGTEPDPLDEVPLRLTAAGCPPLAAARSWPWCSLSAFCSVNAPRRSRLIGTQEEPGIADKGPRRARPGWCWHASARTESRIREQSERRITLTG
jgi:hypothetical protein